MSKALRTVGMVVAAVALVATTAGLAAPAVAATATTAASAGGIAGISAATLTAIGTYGSLAAGALSMAAAATAPGFSAQGSATTFATNPQSGLPYAMGRTRMSGLRVYARTYDGFKQQSKHDILAFVAMLSIAGPIHSIEQFTADNEVVTFAPGEDGDANGRFYRYMAQRLSLGPSSGPALNMTFGGKPFPDWGTSHKLSGIAHAQWALRFDTDGDLYGAGAPEPAWVGKWVKVYDPRKDSTYPGGSGSHRALDEATYEWSDNPGLHALTWALGRWQNGKRVCGIGAPVANIRVSDFVECANVCDANGWKVGGVEWTTDSKWDSLKRILQAGGAVPTQTGAMIGCLTSTPRTAIATIESRHLHDGLTIAATKSRRDRFNTVIPRYVDEDSDWAVISGTAVSESAYVAADGGQRTKEIDFPLVQVFSGETAEQPGQLAAYAIVNSREAGPFTWTTGPEWIGLKTGDVVYLNVPEEGLVNQPVLITRRAPDPATGKVSFAGETETYSKHAYALGQTTTPPVPFSLSAPDLKPAAPLALNWNVSGATSGEGFPALLVTGTSEMPSADAVVIDYRKSGTEPWVGSAILSAVGPVSHTVAPLESATAYDVRIGYRVGPSLGNFTIFANVTTGAGKVTELEEQLGEVASGAAAPSITLSRPTVTLWAYENGIVTDFSSASGLVKVMSAGVDVTASAALSATATGCTGTINSTTASPVAGQPKGYYRVTALPGDSGKLTLTAVYGGKTVTAEFQLNKIRAGYQIVGSTLPTTDLFEGRLVYRESDGKLYRYKSGAWTAAINGADIDNATLTTAKFANDIEPVTIVTSVPGAKSTNSIFNTTDGKLYRWNGSAYVATVPAGDVTGKIVGTQIDDNSIQTPHLAANSVSASKMVVADLTNLAVNNFTGGDMDGWTKGSAAIDLQNVSDGNSRAAGIAGWMARSLDVASWLRSRAASCSPGEQFYFEAWVYRSVVNVPSDVTLLQARFDTDDGTGTGIVPVYVSIGSTTTNGAWVKLSGFATAPANVQTASIWFRPVFSGASGLVYMARPIFRRAASGELIVDGAIVASHLASDSVTAGKVAAGAVNTRELASQAVTASRVVVADLSNLVINNWTGGDMDGWSMSGPFGMIQEGSSNSINAGVAGWQVRVDNSSGWLRSPLSTCSAEEKFYMELWIYRSTAVGTPSSGSLIQARFDVDDGAGNLTATYQTVGSTSTNGSWIKLSAIVTAPANAKTVSLWCRPLTSGSVGRIYFARPIMRRASSGELIVDGDVLARHLASESVTTDKLGVGAVTAAKINVTQLSAITATIGLLRSATTGARFELRSAGLRLFDAGNVQRVTLEV